MAQIQNTQFSGEVLWFSLNPQKPDQYGNLKRVVELKIDTETALKLATLTDKSRPRPILGPDKLTPTGELKIRLSKNVNNRDGEPLKPVDVIIKNIDGTLTRASNPGYVERDKTVTVDCLVMSNDYGSYLMLNSVLVNNTDWVEYGKKDSNNSYSPFGELQTGTTANIDKVVHVGVSSSVLPTTLTDDDVPF